MDRLAQGLARFLEVALGYLFLLITAAIIVLVILRYFFSTTIIGAQEFVAFCFIYTTSLGAAVLLAKREHIAVQVFQDLLSLGTQRWLRRINYLLVALLNGVLLALSIPWIQSVGWFPSPVLRIPQGVVLVSLPMGCGLVVLYALWLAVAESQGNSSAGGGAS